MEEAFTGSLSRGIALGLQSWWMSPRASERAEKNGASGKEEVTSPAEAQSALPPCWAMGTHACRCARVATDVESETGQTQGF